MSPHEVALMFYGGMYGCVGTVALWGVWRLFHPWKCKCGRIHWSASRMMTHLEMKHGHKGKRDE